MNMIYDQFEFAPTSSICVINPTTGSVRLLTVPRGEENNQLSTPEEYWVFDEVPSSPAVDNLHISPPLQSNTES